MSVRFAALLLPFLLLQACLWNPLLKTAPLRDEVVYATTPDGWQIALHHYRPGPGTVPRNTPIVLCHGISANARMWSLDEQRSFPRYLAARGWDVWSVDLRGVGLSKAPALLSDFDFDDYVTQDIPAILDEVARRTGTPQVHWIGHSMGGMVMYGYVSTFGDARLKSLVGLGAPVTFEGYADYLEWAQGQAGWLSPRLFTIWEDAFVPAAAPLVGVFDTRFERITWNFDNLDRETVQKLVYNTTGNIRGGVLRQLAKPFQRQGFTSLDGSVDYVAGLRRLQAPFLVAVGALDNLASVANVMPAWEAAASERKEVIVFSRANGYHGDYGHVDLQLGNDAHRDVYPELERWLRSVD